MGTRRRCRSARLDLLRSTSWAGPVGLDQFGWTSSARPAAVGAAFDTGPYAIATGPLE